MIYGIVPVNTTFKRVRFSHHWWSLCRKLPVVVAFATDVCVLTIMLVGLKLHKGSGTLVKLMAHQGVIWFMIAIAFYIPSVTLVYLDFNDAPDEFDVPNGSHLCNVNPLLLFRLKAESKDCHRSICGNRMQINLYRHARTGICTSEPTIDFAREFQLASGTSDYSGRTFVPFGRLQMTSDTQEQVLHVIGNKPISEDRLQHV
ncbi:hypothetical protein A0H81_08919 [Grifola frondosa]|uniref:Uncharacterized protein n=1 Tax=Grifola frondosa TaxID=5627 RepID=A0A1C7M3B9_GRIFR|nr:hypothetical protein A0H81_08919 [Grifola frondosa]